jgi:hypothetical protein
VACEQERSRRGFWAWIVRDLSTLLVVLAYLLGSAAIMALLFL